MPSNGMILELEDRLTTCLHITSAFTTDTRKEHRISAKQRMGNAIILSINLDYFELKE